MNPVFLKLTEKKDADPEKLLKAIEKELNSVKYCVFGKVKIKEGDQHKVKLEKLQKEKNKILALHNYDKEHEVMKLDQEMASTLKEMDTKVKEREVNYLMNLQNRKGKAAAVFNLRNYILGSKQQSQERIVLEDPETGEHIITQIILKGFP